MADEFSLLLAFDSDDSEFVRGFEAGRAWALLRADEDETQNVMLHAENAEMAIRMAEATGRPFRTLYQDNHWVEVEFGAAVEA